MEMTGTGALAGFSRTLAVPIAAETHSAPRTPGDPVQAFDHLVFQLQGVLFGDPDFDFLQLVAGDGFGLPSPGQTTLTDLGGTFNVDSFFDITYQIDFVGAPGGALDGLSGSTQAAVQLKTGEPLAAIITAEKTDVPGTPAMPGDLIGYQIDIDNVGSDSATGLVFDDTPDPNTTLASGATTTPLALDDGPYAGDPVAPTTVDGTLQPLLLDNDFGIPGTPTLAAIPVVGQPTTLLGSVDINADGSFTYTPPGGASGGEIDTFTYDVQNGIPPSSPVTDTATASILLRARSGGAGRRPDRRAGHRHAARRGGRQRLRCRRLRHTGRCGRSLRSGGRPADDVARNRPSRRRAATP